MKKCILLLIASISLTSLIFSKDITPVFSVRYDSLNDAIAVSDAIGLEMNLGGDRFTGFDTDGNDSRIYVGWQFGKIGFGDDGNGGGKYTVGATYEILDNISMDLDYVYTDDSQNIRLGIQVHF